MAISTITMADGAPSTYLQHDVDYLTSSDENDYQKTNRPLSNLAARDVIFRDKLNEIIAILNAAAGTTADVDARLDVEHNEDGTHIGGAPHGAVSIPIGHTYLSVLNTGGYQNLTATVGSVAGTLCDAGDTRLRRGFVLVKATGGDYTTPKAALDAGHDHIIVAPGVYNDGASFVNMTSPVVIIGIGKPRWIVTGSALSASGSMIENMEIEATTLKPLDLTGVDGFIGRNLKLIPDTAGQQGFRANNCSNVFLENIDVSEIVGPGGGGTIGGIEVGGTYSNWVIRNVVAEQTIAVIYQHAIVFTGAGSDIEVRNVRTAYMFGAVTFLTTALSNVLVDGVYFRDGHNGVLGSYGIAVKVSASGGAISSVTVRNVDADSGAITVDGGVLFDAATVISRCVIENVRSYVGAYGYSVRLNGATEVVDCLVRGVSVRGATTAGIQGVRVQGHYHRLFISDVFMHAMVGIASTPAAVQLQGPTTLAGATEFENISISNVSVIAEYASYGVYLEGNASASGQATITQICITNVNVKNSTGINSICVYFRAAVADTKFKYFTITGVNMSGGAGLIFFVNSTGADTLKFGAITSCTAETTTSYVLSYSGAYSAGGVVIVSGVAWDAATGLFNPGGTQPFYQLAGANQQVP